MSETDITESVNPRNNWSVAQVSSLSILQELKTLTVLWVMSWIGTQCLLLRLYLSDFSTVVTSVKQHCLQRALQLHGTGSDSIDRLLLSLIFHCTKDDDHTRGIKTLEAAFTCVSPSCKTLFLYYNFDTTQPYLKPMWNLGVYLQQRVLQYVLWLAWKYLTTHMILLSHGGSWSGNVVTVIIRRKNGQRPQIGTLRVPINCSRRNHPWLVLNVIGKLLYVI